MGVSLLGLGSDTSEKPIRKQSCAIEKHCPPFYLLFALCVIGSPTAKP